MMIYLQIIFNQANITIFYSYSTTIYVIKNNLKKRIYYLVNQQTNQYIITLLVNFHNIILFNQFCSVEECYTCKNNKFGTVKISCSIVALIKSKFTKEINKTTVGTDDLNLLGWVVLKLDEMSQ